MKFLMTLCLIASLATIAWSSNAVYGRRSRYDSVLYQETVKRRPERYNTWSVTTSYTIPNYRKNITAMEIIDNFRNKSGGIPLLMSGGPGFRFATTNLRGPYQGGIDSTITYFGF